MNKTEKLNALLEYFENNEDALNDLLNDLDAENGFLGDNAIYEMELLPDIVGNRSIFDLLNMAYFGGDDWNKNGSFNPNRDYFYFNGYGNLVSTDRRDYSFLLNEYFIKAVAENKDFLYTFDGLPEEIKALFEEF